MRVQTGSQHSTVGLAGTAADRWKSTGKERDQESGLDYFGARYYGNALGRFTSPDPLPWIHWQRGNRDDQQRFAAYIANPQNLNMYAYVNNNPLNKTDPTGMNACGTSDDSTCHATNTMTTDFLADAVGGAAGTKTAYVRYPLPNVKKELEAIAFSNRRSLRPGKVANLNARAASQSTKNIVAGSVFGTAVANFFSTLWLDITHSSSSQKACVDAHDSHGNSIGQTCTN